jgi:hypothetical protein
MLSRVVAIIDQSLSPIIIGATLIMTINFMTSDFITVLISHGGLAGIILIGIYGYILRR